MHFVSSHVVINLVVLEEEKGTNQAHSLQLYIHTPISRISQNESRYLQSRLSRSLSFFSIRRPLRRAPSTSPPYRQALLLRRRTVDFTGAVKVAYAVNYSRRRYYRRRRICYVFRRASVCERDAAVAGKDAQGGRVVSV